jgi:hypothetical protein
MDYFDKYKKTLINNDEIQYILRMKKLNIKDNKNQFGGNDSQSGVNHSQSGGNDSQSGVNHSQSGGNDSQSGVNDSQSGGKYGCNYQNKFDEICKDDDKGIYKSKESCINDCETRYIDNQLVIGKIKHETMKFFLFIKELINNEKMEVYIKGGNVLGMKILRLIYKQYKNTDKFEYYFNKFLELELIKDWDFVAYSKKKLTDEYKIKIDSIAKKFKLVSRAKTFILYQTKRPILIEDKALYEIAIYDKELINEYSQLEIPLTTMKIQINQFNLKYIFMFSKSFRDKTFDLSIIKRMIEKIHVSIHPYENGMYKTKNIDRGNLSKDMLNFIFKYKQYDTNLPQFLITQTTDLTRMIFRLIEKNIPKTDKIYHFLKNDIKYEKKPRWLLNTKFIMNMIDKFSKELGKKLLEIYKSTKSIEKINLFLTGVRIDRIEIDFDKLTEQGKLLVKNIFSNLIKEIGEDVIKDLNNDDKLNKLLKFLIIHI